MKKKEQNLWINNIFNNIFGETSSTYLKKKKRKKKKPSRQNTQNALKVVDCVDNNNNFFLLFFCDKKKPTSYTYAMHRFFRLLRTSRKNEKKRQNTQDMKWKHRQRNSRYRWISLVNIQYFFSFFLLLRHPKQILKSHPVLFLVF